MKVKYYQKFTQVFALDTDKHCMGRRWVARNQGDTMHYLLGKYFAREMTGHHEDYAEILEAILESLDEDITDMEVEGENAEILIKIQSSIKIALKHAKPTQG